MNGETRPTAAAQQRVLSEIKRLRSEQYPAKASMGAASSWWAERQKAMPILFLLARIAAVTSMNTVPAEQVFGLNREYKK